jgi:hypothetical protein
VLAHRLGLIPLKADARKFSYHLNEHSESSSIKLTLHKRCRRRPEFVEFSEEELQGMRPA